MARRFATRIAGLDSRESIRRKNPIFMTCERFARIASILRFAMFSPSKRDLQRRGEVQFGNPETIRENQAIRANLQIDSRESGHLSFKTLSSLNGRFGPEKKKFSPPPPLISQFAADTLPAPPTPGKPPLLGLSIKKPIPPPS